MYEIISKKYKSDDKVKATDINNLEQAQKLLNYYIEECTRVIGFKARRYYGSADIVNDNGFIIETLRIIRKEVI